MREELDEEARNSSGSGDSFRSVRSGRGDPDYPGHLAGSEGRRAGSFGMARSGSIGDSISIGSFRDFGDYGYGLSPT